MAEGRSRAEWDRTSCLMATMMNMFSKKPVKPSDVNPWTMSDAKSSKGLKFCKENIGEIKEMFMSMKTKKRKVKHDC